jgi:uncharacterized RDD family membrane protein YckC
MAEQGFQAAAAVPSLEAVRAPADKGTRVAGYLIDVLPAIVLGLFGLIPIMGPIMAGLMLTPYWLLRDVTGSSLGKLILRTMVVRKDGQPASAGARVLRNVPLAIGPALLIIPLVGYFLGPATAGIAVLVEGIMLLTQGERVGDRIAGTTVVKK